MERRLASVLNQGYEDCATVVAAFKLIDAFEGLLERDSLQPDLLKKQSELVAAYAIDLRQVNKLFLSQRSKSAEGFYLEREGPPLYMNMPPVAGALFWVRGLLDRVSMPMNKLRGGMSRVLDAEESRDVVKLHDSLVRLLKEYEEAAYKEWEGGVEATSAAKLKQPILVRNEETSLLSVNFDPDLVRLLREVRYFSYLSEREVPPAAADLYKQSETFRVLIGNLQLITGKYNQMLTTLMEVEKPLLDRELKSMDLLLRRGLDELTWKSNEVTLFVRQALNEVSAAHNKLCVLKDNLRQVHEVIDKWLQAPLMKRKATATYAPSDFQEQHKPYLSTRYSEVVDGGKTIHRLLLASNQELKMSKGAPAWKAYVEFVMEIVVSGLASLVGISLKFLAEQIDGEHVAKNEMLPMLELQVSSSNQQHHPHLPSSLPLPSHHSPHPICRLS